MHRGQAFDVVAAVFRPPAFDFAVAFVAAVPRSGTGVCDVASNLYPHRAKKKTAVPQTRTAATNSHAACSYSCPCSVFSWQVMQYRVHGTASSLFCCSSSWQELHSPYVPSLIRDSALSTSASSERSLCVWPNKNSLV